VSQCFLRLQSYSDGNIPNFKIVAYILLGCTDSRGYVKFTLKYIIVGVKGVYQNVLKSSNHILLVTQDHMQSFKIVAYLLLGYCWLVEGGLLILKASLASAEVSAGAVAKADQHFLSCSDSDS
jgi:hypothetical protein